MDLLPGVPCQLASSTICPNQSGSPWKDVDHSSLITSLRGWLLFCFPCNSLGPYSQMHMSPGYGTLNLPHRRFWWPSLMKDVPEYLSVCIICALNKPSRFPLADNSDHFPAQAVLGPTLPLTSPLVFPNLPITWSSSSPFFKVQVTWWPCPSMFSSWPTMVSSSMASPWILSQTKDHSSFPGSGGISILFLAQRLILLLVFTPKQLVRWNKPIGSWKLPCAVISSNQTTWSTVLAWIEYAHNVMTSSTTGFSLFESSLGCQPVSLNSEWALCVASHLQVPVAVEVVPICLLLVLLCHPQQSCLGQRPNFHLHPWSNGLGVYLYVPLCTKSRNVSFHWPMWGWFYGKSCFSLA